MKLEVIKISRYKNKIHGINIGESDEWLLLIYNPVDYVIDGFKIINKKYIKDITSIDTDNISYKVMILKYQDMSIDKNVFKIKTYSTIELLNHIMFLDDLIEVSLGNEDIIYVGKVIDTAEHSFVLNMYNINGEIIDNMRIKYSLIRYIGIRTDYLYSLCKFIDNK